METLADHVIETLRHHPLDTWLETLRTRYKYKTDREYKNTLIMISADYEREKERYEDGRVNEDQFIQKEANIRHRLIDFIERNI